MSNIKDILKTRKFIYGGLTAIILVAGVTFYACKKDSENAVFGSKIMGILGDDGESGRPFPQYENYTPAESTIEGKLLQINNCVNNVEGYVMPNMEIKEAVWFLEAYFNIGVCQKQELPAKYVNKERTYYMEIPISESDGEIILHGEVLQQRYRSVLTEIVTTICSEYAINFGDVYVKSLTADNVIFGLDIMYGPKGTIEAIPEREEMPYEIPFNTKKIIGSYFNPLLYPADGPECPIARFRNGYPGSPAVLSDPGLEAMLNKEKTWWVPVEVTNLGSRRIHANIKPDIDFVYNIKRQFLEDVELEESDYSTYGNSYRDIIYQDRKLQNQVPAGYEPLSAFGWILGVWKNLENKYQVYHEFGIQSYCKFVLPKPYMENVRCELVL